jgi:iron complex outermembrane receptor protein
MHRMSSWLAAASGVALVAGLFAAAAPAFAQSADGTQSPRGRQIEEVVTTSRQRTETLQDVPVAVTGFSRESLDMYNLNDLEKIATDTPNLIVGRGISGSGPTIHLRGVGTNGGSAGFDPAVGIVIDGVSYARGRWVQQGYFDVDRVEVLKGPQALYFGKNNSAGLISLTTADPDAEFEGYGKIGYEIEARETVAEAVASIPLSDTFGVRLAFRFSDFDGFIRNQAEPIVGQDPLGFVIPGALNKRLPNEQEYLGRVTLKWVPNDNLEAKLKVSAARNTDSSRYSTLQQLVCYGPNGEPQPIFGVRDPYDDCTQNFTQSLADLPDELMSGEPDEFKKNGGEQWSEFESFSATFQADYSLEDITLTSITAYTWYDNQYMGNSEFSAQGQVGVYENARYGTFSQELRGVTTLDGPFNLLAGVYFQDIDFSFRNSARIFPAPADPVTGRYWSYDKISTTRGKTWSAFAELTWNITDAIELTGGARYTRETKDSDLQSTYVHSLLRGALTDRSLQNKFKDTNVSPQATVTWRPSEELTLYGAYRQGFKSGGFDNSFLLTNTSAEREDLTFKSETSNGFEIGAKTALLDRTLQINATAYRYTFKNLQVQELDTETTQFKIRNAGKARTTGVEMDFTWLASDALSLRGAAAYNDGHYVDFIVGCYSGQSIEAGCDRVRNPANGRFTSQDRSGEPLIKAPKWTLRLGFSYELPLTADWRWMLTGDASYSDDYLLDEKGTPGAVQDDYVLVDASARLLDADDRWEFAVIGRNLSNRAIAFTGLGRPLTGGSSGLPAGTPGQTFSDVTVGVQRGREIMFQITYRFH